MFAGGKSFSEGLLGRGGGARLSWLSLRSGKVLDLSSSVNRPGRLASLCRRPRNASIPSLASAATGNGGGAIAVVTPGLFLLGMPLVVVEYAEPRDVLDANDVRDLGPLPLLLTLPCVSVLRCPSETSRTGDLGALAVLGRRLSKGPGAMLSMRLETFSPPFMRGLRGAKRGLGWGYCCLYPSLSRSCGGELRVGVARVVGNLGNAESMLPGRSGDGAGKEGIGLVALRLKAYGDFGPADRNGERLLGSL